MILITIGLVIKGTFWASVVSGGTPLLYSAHDYTFLPKPKGSAFGKIVLEVVLILLSKEYFQGGPDLIWSLACGNMKP